MLLTFISSCMILMFHRSRSRIARLNSVRVLSKALCKSRSGPRLMGFIPYLNTVSDYIMINKHRGVCQELSAVESWDDAITFTEAKIRELKASIQGFKMAKDRGDKWLGGIPTQANHPTPEKEPCHTV